MTRERRLGRGLAALLGTPQDQENSANSAESTSAEQAPAPAPPSQPESHSVAAPPVVEEQPPVSEATVDSQPSDGAQDDGSMVLLNVDQIDTNPFQPRRVFNEPEIAALAESLKSHDMLQPVLVRRDGDRYQLISGERRMRAATLAGWVQVPARVRQADDRLVAELAIVENLQRKDLDPIEKALSFRRYLDEHGSTQEELAKRLKINRSTIANLMRLLELPSSVQTALAQGEISAGHARALLPLGEESLQVQFANQIREQGMSVRDTEQLVSEKVQQEDGEPLSVVHQDGTVSKVARPSKSDQVASLEGELRMALGAKVDIKQGAKGRGKLVIHFKNHDEFERLRNLLIQQGGVPVPQEESA